jgi:saccharopine dehydrogenase (NADP+, L-glutamate forming)
MQRINGHPNGKALGINTEDAFERAALLNEADLVISMLPAHMHPQVAADCLSLGKHFFTASYISPYLHSVAQQVKEKKLLFMNEAGLDPGIDHMSAMQIIKNLQHQGASITGFESYCGGLVAPESNDNPWGYKFSWNPRNVILAGQGTARYLDGGILRFLPYHRLFSEATSIEVPGMGTYDAYPNRDSVSYLDTYGLQGIQRMIRGTLRAPGYCKAWNLFVQLGLTDDSFTLDAGNKTYSELLDGFLPGKGDLTERLRKFAGEENSDVVEKVLWTGIGEKKKIGLDKASPAAILEHLLKQKWVLNEQDKDLVVMQHIFTYTLQNKPYQLTSTLVNKGENTIQTAMSRTVGLPLAIIADEFMKGTFDAHGVCMPIQPEIYEPVLQKLSEMGITFTETHQAL